jgi:hypothetical protein
MRLRGTDLKAWCMCIKRQRIGIEKARVQTKGKINLDVTLPVGQCTRGPLPWPIVRFQEQGCAEWKKVKVNENDVRPCARWGAFPPFLSFIPGLYPSSLPHGLHKCHASFLGVLPVTWSCLPSSQPSSFLFLCLRSGHSLVVLGRRAVVFGGCADTEDSPGFFLK